MQIFCSCNLWRKRLVLGLAQLQPQQCPCLCSEQRQRAIPCHVDSFGGEATTFVSGVPILLQFLDHLEEHQCRRGVRRGQNKRIFLVFNDWMLAEILPEPMGLLSQRNGWAGGATGIFWWETEAKGGFRDQWTEQLTRGTALEVHKSYNKKDHPVMGKRRKIFSLVSPEDDHKFESWV